MMVLLWQVAQVIAMVTECAEWAPGPVAPVAGEARPFGPPTVPTVGGLPWQEVQLVDASTMRLICFDLSMKLLLSAALTLLWQVLQVVLPL
jgi:hypothetical protein